MDGEEEYEGGIRRRLVVVDQRNAVERPCVGREAAANGRNLGIKLRG